MISRPHTNVLRSGNVAATTAAALGLLIVSLWTAALFTSTFAEAQYRRLAPIAGELPPTEGRGCYFYRGRQICGRYCYWEVNGKRYCRQRERDAYSQAPVIVDELWEPPLK